MSAKTHVHHLLAVPLIALCLAVLLNSCAKAEDNVVRVLLTRLNLSDRVTVSLDGSYTLGDISFQRGSKLTFSCAAGPIIVYYEGMALDVGNDVRLIRHATDTDGENGLRIDGGYALYCGDLRLKAENKTLRAILHIPVEEYLLGVVPYEMSDSFPLEALKSQAVAARTYALRKANGAGDYDLVDNTNDQVYRGYQKENRNAAQAVLETAGVCGFYQNALANCYYTASNGGQVEIPDHVWGKNDGNYITMHADPYDVENPESTVKKISIAKKPANGIVGNAAFTNAVKLLMAEPLAAMGYTGDAEDINILAVDSMELHTPKDSDQSMVMTQLRLTVRAEAKKLITRIEPEEEEISIFQVPLASSGPVSTTAPQALATPAPTPALSDFQPLAEPVTVDVPVFTGVKPILGLGINGTNNEIFTVTETDTAFRIEARRYGHGVGMSQRGAQWMAGQYKWTYDQILRFYYPGVTLKEINTRVVLPPAVGAQFLITPGPAATPTPRPTLIPIPAELKAGEWRARVTQIGVNSYLNLRSAPSMEADVLRQLYYGQEMIVEQQLPDGWLKVRIGTLEGYVMEQYVERMK
ncbi:MAG: SpoIID/LytB domain-containing protein [Clostridia bacterium]|nr:SpoIID/LytB domain-containing protein [Clostridia bacterium]